jgi:hypothetical protein
VAAWDRDRNGIMDGNPEARPRGIPSYYQQDPKPMVGADLLAAQYRGYLVYAAIQRQKGTPGSLSQQLAEEYAAKAQALRAQYNTTWWNPIQNRHYSLMLPNGRFYPGYVAEGNVFALLFGLTEEGLKTDAALDSLEKNRPDMDQKLSYFPEVLFAYGRNEAAYRYLLELTDPNFRGRGMPEVVFAVIGAVATGMGGISPDALHDTLETLPRLPKAVDWVTLNRVPVLANEVTVRHRGLTETAITNLSGPAFRWKASFPIASIAPAPQVLVDGVAVPVIVEHRLNHQPVGSIVVPLQPGQTRTAKLVN